VLRLKPERLRLAVKLCSFVCNLHFKGNTFIYQSRWYISANELLFPENYYHAVVTCNEQRYQINSIFVVEHVD
jgi:hypothetical protein